MSDKKFMYRCFELARKGIPCTTPNPLVGSVIVHKNKIIGEGFHRKYGQAHAEVNAINSVVNKDLLKESTLYVNLEPCAHQGKTPPCSDLIIKHKIPKVVISNTDIFAKVNGRGIEKMQKAGINLKIGILEADGLKLNRRFFNFHIKKRPYIILKWAQTKDNFIANHNYDSKWITNKYSRTLVHKFRAREAAIMVGYNTAKYDNPKLNVRMWEGLNPVRIVIDKYNSLNRNLNLFDKSIPTTIFNDKIDHKDLNLNFVKINHWDNYQIEILKYLYNQEIQSLFIEGGSGLLNDFINTNLWDEAIIFTGNKFMKKGIKAPEIKNFSYIKEFDIACDKVRQIFNSC